MPNYSLVTFILYVVSNSKTGCLHVNTTDVLLEFFAAVPGTAGCSAAVAASNH